MFRDTLIHCLFQHHIINFQIKTLRFFCYNINISNVDRIKLLAHNLSVIISSCTRLTFDRKWTGPTSAIRENDGGPTKAKARGAAGCLVLEHVPVVPGLGPVRARRGQRIAGSKFDRGGRTRLKKATKRLCAPTLHERAPVASSRTRLGRRWAAGGGNRRAGAIRGEIPITFLHAFACNFYFITVSQKLKF